MAQGAQNVGPSTKDGSVQSELLAAPGGLTERIDQLELSVAVHTAQSGQSAVVERSHWDTAQDTILNKDQSFNLRSSQLRAKGQMSQSYLLRFLFVSVSRV